MKSKTIYYIIVIFLFLLNLSIFAPPYLIWSGHLDLAGSLYNLHNYDHQWIYRSECVFEDLSIQDCIPRGFEDDAYIETIWTTNGDPIYNGDLDVWEQNQIGVNKAEKVIRDGITGYKFANDTRDYAIYLPWFLVMVFYPFFSKHRGPMPSAIWFVIALIPMGIDGTTQLLAGMFDDPTWFWGYHVIGEVESTNLLRWITGGIAGLAVGYYVVHMLDERERRRQVKKHEKENQ